MAGPISLTGVGFGAALGAFGGGYIASKMTRTPANKRVLYSGLIQIAAGWLLRKRWPAIALGMAASGVVNVISIAMTSNASALMDGSRFVPAGTLAPAEAGSLLLSAPAATSTQSSTSSLQYSPR